MGLTAPDYIDVEGHEQWRDYDWYADGISRVYRVTNPHRVYVGVTTHRVVDDQGIVHVLPAPGQFGCVVRFAGQVVA